MLKILLLFLLWLSFTFKDSSGRIIVMDRDNRTLTNHEQLKDVTNLNGFLVRIVFIKGPTHKGTKLTGAIGDIWYLLGECHNFTLVPTGLEMKKFQGRDPISHMMQLLVDQEQDFISSVPGTQDDRVHYTFPVFNHKETFYMRLILKTNESWLSSLIEYKIWFVVAGFKALMCIIGWLSDRLLVPKKSRLTFMDHIVYNHSVLCLQGYLPESFNSRGKILRVVKNILVFMFWGYFGTFLYTQLSTKIPTIQFNGVNDLLENTNITILGHDRTLPYGPLGFTLGHPLYKKRIEMQTELVDSIAKICSSRPDRYTILMPDIAYELYKGECPLKKMGETVFVNKYPSAVRKGFKFKKSIDIGLLKLEEYGLLKRSRKLNAPLAFDKTPANPEVEPLGLDHFKYVFGLWAIGMTFACIIFVVEVIIWDIREKQKEKKIEPQLRNNNIRDVERNINIDIDRFVWSDCMIRLLLDQLKQRREHFKCQPNHLIWKKVAKVFHSKGYRTVTDEKCTVQWRSMKKTYKNIRESNNKSTKQEWVYFDLVDDLMKKKSEIVPLGLAWNQLTTGKRNY